MRRGAVNHEQAYAQGKMLDHSGWSNLLPRHITPSDIDAVFANGREMLLIELSSSAREWAEISKGQLRLYQDIVLASEGRLWAVLCHHKTPSNQKILTDTDIVSFQVMVRNRETLKPHSSSVVAVGPENEWKQFVLRYFNESRGAAWKYIASRYRTKLECESATTGAPVASATQCPDVCFCETCRYWGSHV